MSTNIDTIYGAVAQCNFDADAGGGAFRTQRGFLAAFTRTGVGDYTFTFDSPQDVANLVPHATALGAVSTMIVAALVAGPPQQVRVTTWDNAGVAAEIDFTLTVFKNGPV